MENKPNTLQEALQIIEAANIKINEISAQRDSFEAENINLKKTSEENSAEIFALKSSVETEQKTSAVLKQKLEVAEAKNSELQTKLETSENAKSQTETTLSELQGKYDALSKKDMDVETRASARAAQITGESGIEKPVENASAPDEPSMEEIAQMLSKADGRAKAELMEKYGDKISAYLKRK